ncbi:MAG: Maltose O-acetyltransferase [Microgenomates bacterium OLB22]|nr:MAG: Maltose O-acetyltransferase [Microgenomates bacterium OLB22]
MLLKTIMKEIVFENGLPKKDRLKLGLMFLRWPLIFPFVRNYITRSFSKSGKAEIIPGFMCFYGNIMTGKDVVLNDTFLLDYAPISIGENTKFSFENMVITSQHDRVNFDTVRAKPIHIGKNVWVTSRCIILPGVTIGDNTTIGAGSVVTKDIPANCFAAGNPAKPIKYYES